MNDQHQSTLNILMICLKNAFNISIAHNFDLNIWSWARAHERDKKLLEVTHASRTMNLISIFRMIAVTNILSI